MSREMFDGEETHADHEQLLRVQGERISELVAEVAGLRTALEHRAVIEQAKGVLMRERRCAPDAAFDVLVERSMAENRKLRTIAAELVERQQRDASAPAPGADGADGADRQGGTGPALRPLDHEDA